MHHLLDVGRRIAPLREQARHAAEVGDRLQVVRRLLAAEGPVEVGADADLVLWNDNLTPRRTWVGGECVFQDESNTDERADR